jgi:hypothetical protein
MAAQRKVAEKQAPAKRDWHVVIAKRSAVVDMDGRNTHVHSGARYASTHPVVRAHSELFEREETAGLNIND